MNFETLETKREGAVLFVEIAAPTMNLLVRNWFVIWSPSFSSPRLMMHSESWCSRVPTRTISFLMST